MRRRLFFWEAAGAVFTAAAGTALHFLYDWSGGASLAAAFSAVNESTWEHMKLLFFPLFLFTAVQAVCMGRGYPNFLAVRGLSALVGTALIPVLFYTYTGVLGFHTSRLKITCADETPWTLDGEYGGSPQAAEITACRHAVNIVYGA